MRWELTDNDRRLTLREATEMEIEQVRVTFTKKAESARFDPRVKKGLWDGNISHFRANRYLPSGLWHELVEMCKEFDMPLTIDGVERLVDRSVTLEEFKEWAESKWGGSSMELRDYQVETAWKIVRHRSCLVELATSAGKSFVAFMAVSFMMERGMASRLLMVVPTVDLVIQMTTDFQGYNRGTTDLELRYQQVYSGAEEQTDANVVIGTYQSLVKRREFLAGFDLVVVDEVHKAKSNSIKTILERCTGSRRRFGMSGTIPKPGTLNRLTVMAHTGPIVNSVKADFLQEKGFISQCEIYVVEMDYAPEEAKRAFKQLYDRSPDDRKDVLNMERNYAIESRARLDFVTGFILKNTRNSLVLFHRIEYGQALYNELRSRSENHRVYYIDGGTPSEVREAHKATMEEGDHRILVASFGTFSTGINIRKLHVVYLTESFKSEVIIRQSIGRGLRKHESKDKLIVVDFTDDFRTGRFVNYLYQHSLERRRIYKEEKFAYTVRKVELPKPGGLF